VAAIGRLDRQVLQTAEAVASVGGAGDDDVEHLLLLEQVADLDPGHHCRHCSAHVAGLESVRLNRVQVDFHLDGWFFDLQQEMRIIDAIHAGDRLAHFLRLLAQDVQVGTEHAHDNWLRCAGPGQHLANTFLEVRHYVVRHTRRAVSGTLQSGHAGVVVRLRVDADPVQTGVDADDLVALNGAPDLAGEVAYTGQAAHLLTSLCGNARHFGQRGARIGRPVHNEVVFLELWQQRLAEEWDDGKAGHAQRRHRKKRGARSMQRRHQHTLVRLAKPARKWRLFRIELRVGKQDQTERGVTVSATSIDTSSASAYRKRQWLEERGQPIHEQDPE
jgi:hypothetical protein